MKDNVDLNTHEVEKTDVLDVEIMIQRLKTKNAPGMENLQLEHFKDYGEGPSYNN